MVITNKTRLSGLRWNFVPKAFRFGRQFHKSMAFLSASQFWSKDELEAYQLTQIKALVRHAHTFSPFYRSRFASIGLEPDDVKSLDDFRKIPLLTKNDIRHNFEDIRTDKMTGEEVILTQTGGTTGAPVKLLRSKTSDIVRQAVEWRTYAMGGTNPYGRKLYAFGQMSYDETVETFYFDHRLNGLWMRSYMVDSERMHLFYQLWKEYRPALVTGHIEVMRAFIRFIGKNSLSPISTGAFFSIGEAIQPGDHELIQEAFSCPLFDYYGLRENAASASDCVEQRMHINAEFTLMEFLSDGLPAPLGQPADIVGTNLHNFAFPIIRYATNDLGTLTGEHCTCGRHLPTMQLLGGRERDLIVTKNHLVTITHHVPVVIGMSSGIEEIQFYQPDRDRLVIRIKKNDAFSDSDEEKIIQVVRNLTFDELALTVQYVESIPRTPLGKFRFTVSDVPQEL